jgi:hypothetical protein
MIQRIQTIFLFFAAASFFALFYIPFASSDVAAGQLLGDKMYSVEDHILLGGLCILGGVLSVVAIFLYKNRPLQLRMGYFVMVAAVLIVITAIMLFLNESKSIDSSINISEGFGIGMPILTITLVALANRFIKKDQNIVKSMDRLR